MTLYNLLTVLSTLPDGTVEVIVRGRRSPEIFASIPRERLLPHGWTACAEPSIQMLDGFIRVRYTGAIK